MLKAWSSSLIDAVTSAAVEIVGDGVVSSVGLDDLLVMIASISDIGVVLPLLEAELRAARASRCLARLSSTSLRFAKLGTLGAFLVARGSEGGGVGVERVEWRSRK